MKPLWLLEMDDWELLSHIREHTSESGDVFVEELERRLILMLFRLRILQAEAVA